LARLSVRPLADVDDNKRRPRRQIGEVEKLLRAWDPIGVIGDLIADGLPPNEYDDYAPHIVGMLQRGATREDLVAHLRYCRTGAMGLEPNDAADTATANEICAWWHRETLTVDPNVG
jgi:hypothetical protein